MLTPIVRSSAVDQAFAALRSRILHGAFPPGARLPTEAELGESLGVSRSTVREALNRLAAARLVAVQHGGARTVLDPRDHAGLEVLRELITRPDGAVDAQVARSVIEARSVLAPDAARLAAVRRAEADAHAVVAAAAGMAGELGLDVRVARSLAFWSRVVEASGNLAYRLAFNSLRVAPAGDVALFRALIREELEAAPLYTAIADAVLHQRPEEARAAAAALVDLGARALTAALDAAGAHA